eukprot:2612621-Pyramimonas_sp.AAC.1
MARARNLRPARVLAGIGQFKVGTRIGRALGAHCAQRWRVHLNDSVGRRRRLKFEFPRAVRLRGACGGSCARGTLLPVPRICPHGRANGA